VRRSGKIRASGLFNREKWEYNEEKPAGRDRSAGTPRTEERNPMSTEKTRFLSYICPRCRQSVIVERDVFALAAAPAHIKCPCGKSELSVEFMPQRVRLSVPCVYCGRDHLVSCPSHAFLRERALAFSCTASGLDCCYVGEQEAVFAAMRRLEETVDVLESEAGAQGMFLNDLVMEEILEELRDIGRRDGISCTCGSRAWNLKINYSSVELTCARCGAGLKIPAATMSDIEDLCCKPTLTIRGKEPPAE